MADLELGSFTEDGPWLVEPDAMTWRVGLDVIRTATRRSVPDLIRPRRTVPIRRLTKVTFRLSRALVPWALGARRKAARRAARCCHAASARR